MNLNDLSPLNACPGNRCWYSQSEGQMAAWRNWTGAAWAWGYSPNGALVFWGGGHGGGEDVGLYVFDFSTGLWSRVGPQNPPQSFTASLDATWDDYFYQGDYLVPGLHTYNYPAYVPPFSGGSGPRGSWLLPQHISGRVGARPHAVDLSTGRWTRFAVEPGVSGASPYAGSIEDTKRGRVWWGAMDQASLNMLDFGEAHPRRIKVIPCKPSGSIFAFGGYYARHVYVPEADMAVGFWCQYAQQRVLGEIYSFSTGEPVRVAGAPWPEKLLRGPGFGVDWCGISRRFYFYGGYGSTRVVSLRPSSLDFSSCSWTWDEEVFSNPAWAPRSGNVITGGETPMSRWRFVPRLGCFGWSDGPNFRAVCADGATRDGVMQLWRPRDA